MKSTQQVKKMQRNKECKMSEYLAIIAKFPEQARQFADEHRITSYRYFYVDCANKMMDYRKQTYVALEGWTERKDAEEIASVVKANGWIRLVPKRKVEQKYMQELDRMLWLNPDQDAIDAYKYQWQSYYLNKDEIKKFPIYDGSF